MSRPVRSWYALAAVCAIAGGAIAWIVVVFGTVLLTGAGTGEFLDPWRAFGRAVTTGSTWITTAGGAVVGGVVGAVVGALQNKQK